LRNGEVTSEAIRRAARGAGLAVTRRYEFRGSGRFCRAFGLKNADTVPAGTEWVDCVDGIRFTAATPRDIMLRALYVHGHYQDDVLVALTSLLKPGDVFWDIGANYGFMSVYVHRHLGSQIEIVPFEPNPIVAPYLRKNLDANGAAETSIEQRCLSDSVGTVTFYTSSENSWNATMMADFAAQHGESDRVEVPSSTLDLVVKERRPPSVIKLDVEGAEPLVLAGGRDFLAANRPPIVAEFNRQGFEKDDPSGRGYVQLYRDLGYAPHFMPRPLVGWHRWDRLRPVHSVEELPDLCNLVFLAESPRPG
jgi:FkbM family methyltransferase